MFAIASVYVICEPAETDGVAVLTMLMSALAWSVVVAVDELFVLLVSIVVVETVAVFEMEPVALLAVFSTSWNVAVELPANDAIVQFTVPFAPTAGVVQLKTGPVCCANETNVVPAGMTSLSCVAVAAVAPLFVTVIE